MLNLQTPSPWPRNLSNPHHLALKTMLFSFNALMNAFSKELLHELRAYQGIRWSSRPKYPFFNFLRSRVEWKVRKTQAIKDHGTRDLFEIPSAR